MATGRGRARAILGGVTGGRGRGGDQAAILAGTVQNIIGLAVFVLATFAANVLISRAFGGGDLGAEALGVVTLATQFAFIGAAATRFGMDMAAVRHIAIEVGQDRGGRARGIGWRALAVAAGISLCVGAIIFAFAGPLAREFTNEADAKGALQAAALALPFVAVTFVALSGSRGLKIMRHTLYVQWVGQPLAWIAFMLLVWQVSKTVGGTVFAYAISWLVAAAAAMALWHREAARFEPTPIDRRVTRELVRFGAPRAPAALLSQALFWLDYFVAAAFVPRGDVSPAELGVYSASVRVAQVLVLFLTAVSYMFSPFVADLHARGERDRLDRLFKSLTRWTMAGTIPLLMLLLVLPAPLLRIFGGQAFAGGDTALRILVLGQAVNVAVGAVGFILIMVGRTGWDLAVYVASFLLDLVVAITLVPVLGTEGAAIAQATTIAASNALRLYLVWRFVRIQPFNRHYLGLVLPAAVCLVAMIATASVLHGSIPIVQLIGTALVGGLVYLPVLMLFGLTPTEKTTIRHLVSRRPGGEHVRIRPVGPDDAMWVRELMRARWAGETQVVHGQTYEPATLPGFVAVEDGERPEDEQRVGLVTYQIHGGACEVVTLDSLDEGRGIGSALVEAVRGEAERAGCARLWLTTTNENRHAQGFYEAIGFRVAAVRGGAVDEARKLKPSIPVAAPDGTPITDEIEFELPLG